MPRHGVLAVGAAMVVMALAAPAAAAAPEPNASSLSDAEIQKRLDFLEERLDGSKLHGQIWTWSWGFINGGSMVALGVLAGLSKHEDDQVNYGVQAGVSALGVGDVIFRPVEAAWGADRIRDMPDDTHEQRLEKLRAAEKQLESNAERADERWEWQTHAANVGLNGAAGLAIGLAGRPSDGIIAFVAGALGGEAYIFTEPSAPTRDWQDYKQQFSKVASRSEVHFALAPMPSGGAHASVVWTW